MKGNRRIELEPSLAEQGLDRSRPPAGSLFDALCSAGASIADAAQALPYLQGIREGTLDPTQFGAYNVADAYYCYHGAEDYASAAARAQAGSLVAKLLEKKRDSYLEYNASFPSTWNLASAQSISPPVAVRIYVEFESTVTTQLAPIYCLVAMLPCEYLWYWLAHQMAPAQTGNLYAAWITDNDAPGGAYAMGNFLDAYQREHPQELDTDRALWLYRFGSYCEYAGFAAGTGADTQPPSHFGLCAPTWAGEGWPRLAELYRKFEAPE